MGYSLWKIKKKRVFSSSIPLMLSFYRSSSSLVCDPMVGSGRMPPGLSVMYEFVSFSVCGVFLWKLTSVIKVSQSKVNTEVRSRRETHK